MERQGPGRTNHPRLMRPASLSRKYSVMRVTAITTQTQRKRQDRFVRHAEERRCRARMTRGRGLICPTSNAPATVDDARGKRHLFDWQNKAILPSSSRPFGEFRYNYLSVYIIWRGLSNRRPREAFIRRRVVGCCGDQVPCQVGCLLGPVGARGAGALLASDRGTPRRFAGLPADISVERSSLASPVARARCHFSSMAKPPR